MNRLFVDRRENFAKIKFCALDDLRTGAIFFVPPKAGLFIRRKATQSVFLYIWDCKLAQFCPAGLLELGRRQAFKSGRGIEFFCALNVRKRWFFDIYIQGSKKYNFLELSLKSRRSPQGGQRVSVIKESGSFLQRRS